MRKMLAFIFLLFVLTGCTTVGGMQTATPSGGNVQSYDVSYQKAYDAAQYACNYLDFKVESENAEQGNIVASKGMTALSYGERVGIYLKKITPEKTEVRVISKAKLQTNIFAPKWDDKIHQEIRNRLQQVAKSN